MTNILDPNVGSPEHGSYNDTAEKVDEGSPEAPRNCTHGKMETKTMPEGASSAKACPKCGKDFPKGKLFLSVNKLYCLSE